MFFSQKKLNKDYDMFASKAPKTLGSIVDKFKALSAEANEFAETNRQQVQKLEAKLEEARTTQQQAEAIAANLSKFLGE